jgi:hypothetical protein
MGYVPELQRSDLAFTGIESFASLYSYPTPESLSIDTTHTPSPLPSDSTFKIINMMIFLDGVNSTSILF